MIHPQPRDTQCQTGLLGVPKAVENQLGKFNPHVQSEERQTLDKMSFLALVTLFMAITCGYKFWRQRNSCPFEQLQKDQHQLPRPLPTGEIIKLQRN